MWLALLGAEVLGYSIEAPSQPSFFQATGLAAGITHVHGDIRDLNHLESVFSQFRPEIVFHLAAQPLVLRSYSEPCLTYQTNIMGTVNLLEAIRQTDSVQVGLIITSDKVYENREMVWGYRENDPLGGTDPYSSSKGCTELITSAYRKSYFSSATSGPEVAVASARAGNVIGGGDWGQNRLLPDCIRALSRGEPITVRNPQAVRPWQHVIEALYGYLILGSRLKADGRKFSGAWNFGPSGNEVQKVEELVKEIIRFWGEGTYNIASGSQSRETNWLKLDSSKANIQLGWRPKYSITEALEYTILWYKEFYRGASEAMLWQVSAQQIADYTSASTR